MGGTFVGSLKRQTHVSACRCFHRSLWNRYWGQVYLKKTERHAFTPVTISLPYTHLCTHTDSGVKKKSKGRMHFQLTPSARRS